MQPPNGGNGGGGSSSANNGHSGGAQSMHDMQRFQLQQQFRQQQQFGGGGGTLASGGGPLSMQQGMNPSAAALAAMMQQQQQQQQQQHGSTNSLNGLPGGMQGLGHTQQLQGHDMSAIGNSSFSSSNMDGNSMLSNMNMGAANANAFGNWNNPLQQQQHHQPHSLQQQPQSSPMDASSGSSARLMAMTGMNMGGNVPFSAGMHGSSNAGAAGNYMGAGGVMGLSNMTGPNTTGLQTTMQAVLLQRQRQQQQQQQQDPNLGGNHHSIQQQQRSMMMSGIPTTFNSAGQQPPQHQANNPMGPTGGSVMGMQGMASLNSASSDPSNQQQQFLFQQQLAAMQKQQQQLGGGGSAASNAAMVAMHNMQQQQQQQMGGVPQQNHSRANSITGPNNANAELQQQQGGVSSQHQQQQSFFQARQQQLLQQMQQQRGMSMNDASSLGGDGGGNPTAAMMQQIQQQQQQQQHRNSGNQSMLMSNATGMMSMMQQQQQQQQPSQMGMGQHQHGNDIGLSAQQQQLQMRQHMQSDGNPSNAMGMMGGANFQQQSQQMMHGSFSGPNGLNLNNSSSSIGGLDHNMNAPMLFGGGNGNEAGNEHGGGGMNANADASSMRQQSGGSVNPGGDAGGSGNSVSSADQTFFLDGRFAGGWQSNADLPDRRRVIFNILEVIRQMRPETNKLANKLPHMAKSLEEHLYRSAKSKEDYMDVSTLKQRLQAIAHGLEIHRSSDDVSASQGDEPLGLSQLSTSLRNDDDAGSQSSNFSVAAAVRSSMAAAGSNMSMPTGGSMNQTSSPPLGGMGGGNPQQENTMALQGSLNQRTGSPGGFHQQPMRHQSEGWSASQNAANANLMMSQSMAMQPQQDGNMFQMNSQNAGNAMLQQLNQGQMGHSDSLGESQNSEAFSMNANAQGSQANFPNPSGSSNQIPQDQSSAAAWGSFVPGNSNPLLPGSSDFANLAKFQDPTASQKKRVIIQQQQRLLLLRHASKCTAGLQCTTKFCDQMVTLWKHMKTCRNKNCKTSHCLSSRCVLNHYRICKSNSRTSTCEVCGPVMLKIKQQERDDGTGSTDDPLTRDQDTLLLQGQMSMGSFQSRQHGDPNDQLYQVQAQQSKLKAQLDSLKVLQRQQEQLLEQQKNLEMQAQSISDPTSHQARQLQEQQILLQQLQKRCQQQQLLVQDELQMQSVGLDDSTSSQYRAQEAGHQGTDNVPAADDKPNPREMQQVQKTRRGSGIGKRFGKSLGLPAARRISDSEENASKKKRPSVVKAERSSKKPRQTGKSRNSSSKSDGDDDSTGPPKLLEEDYTSLLSRMTQADIQKHLESLNKRIVLSSRTVTHKCRPIIQEIIEDQFGWVFRDAVDPVALGLPDYYDVIKNPMHLDLIRKKLENAIYSDMESFARDTRLVFENAILYNGESSEVGELAQIMLSRFDKLYNTVVHDIESSHVNLESQGELCSLCGVQKRRFEPTVLYCQGKCGMQRIKRNAAYFTDRTKQNHWCDTCFAQLDPDERILLDDGTKVLKKELQELKNDALPEEGWVNCDECHSWVHQVCALFNGRTNKSSARFTCPSCYMQIPKTPESLEKGSKSVKGSQDLARCTMSDAIEQGLADALQAAYASRSSELGVDIDEVEKVDGLCVRVLSNVEKRQFVGEKMMARYSTLDYPSEFPVRSKCIGLFQKIHGVDTLLFAMYVYEYGHDCPAPNKRRVYISYLDSVQYFEPKCYRTTAYQAIMIEYLRYVKKRGFHTAAIWSCPPVGGDDYIFYCHPKHQLVPQEDMLRSWYHKMLDQAKNQGVVIRTTTLYDEYFSSDSVDQVPGQRRDPTCLPYFEGDYIPGEIENIVQQLEARGETIQAGSSLQDSVMVRLGHSIQKMKDNFIVVHLRNRRFAAAVERGEDVSNWKEDSDDDMLRSKRAKISGKSPSEPDSKPVETDIVAAPATHSTKVVLQPLDEEVRNRSVDESTVESSPKVNLERTDDSPGEGSKEQRGDNPDSGDPPEKEKVASEDNKIRACSETVAKDKNEIPSETRCDIEKSKVPDTESGADATEHAPNSDETKPTEPTSSEADPLTVGDDTASKGRGKISSDAPIPLAKCDTMPSSENVVGTPAKLEPATNSHDTITDAGHIVKDDTATEIQSRSETVSSSHDVPLNEIRGADKVPATNSRDTIKDAGHIVKDDTTTETKSCGETASSSHDVPLNESQVADKLPSPVEADVLQQKRVLEDIKPAILNHMSGLQASMAIVGDTSDDDPPMESEMFESRQQFLNYCQTTHCQFDDLRRAKHSSVMVLFQLHNPMAPKFLQQCGACYRDITHGVYYRCNDCSNFDLCEECHEPVTSGLWAKKDPRFAHDKSHTFTAIDMEGDEETQKSQAESRKGLKTHIELLEHAGSCPGSPDCSIVNCERMKQLFKHVGICEVVPKKDCKVCTRLFALCTMHSRLCTARSTCPIPFCDRIRERNKRLRRQQQQMDDRRRQAQNELYHAGGNI